MAFSSCLKVLFNHSHHAFIGTHFSIFNVDSLLLPLKPFLSQKKHIRYTFRRRKLKSHARKREEERETNDRQERTWMNQQTHFEWREDMSRRECIPRNVRKALYVSFFALHISLLALCILHFVPDKQDLFPLYVCLSLSLCLSAS